MATPCPPVFFHGAHGPSGWLSQWYKRPFRVERTYCCAEQYMMYQKAMLFGDHQTAEQIMRTDHPASIKKMGRLVKGFDQAVWEQHRERIVYDANLFKFSEEPLRTLLLATGDAQLVEASPYDAIWGAGLSADQCASAGRWPGLNLLGLALERVRNTLRAAQ